MSNPIPHPTEEELDHKTEVAVIDLWFALDALDAVPEAAHTEWYQRLQKAASEATQVMTIESGMVKTH